MYQNHKATGGCIRKRKKKPKHYFYQNPFPQEEINTLHQSKAGTCSSETIWFSLAAFYTNDIKMPIYSWWLCWSDCLCVIVLQSSAVWCSPASITTGGNAVLWTWQEIAQDLWGAAVFFGLGNWKLLKKSSWSAAPPGKSPPLSSGICSLNRTLSIFDSFVLCSITFKREINAHPLLHPTRSCSVFITFLEQLNAIFCFFLFNQAAFRLCMPLTLQLF